MGSGISKSNKNTGLYVLKDMIKKNLNKYYIYMIN